MYFYDIGAENNYLKYEDIITVINLSSNIINENKLNLTNYYT